jgi:hypothetical protein
MTVKTALSMPRLIAIGDEPAVTFFRPSRKIASARTVAVVVPSPATSDVLEATRDHLGAHVLVRAFELDLLGDRHAVLRHRGRAPLLVDHDVATARSEGHLDGLGEGFDTLQDRLAGLVAEQQLLCSHGSNLPESCD